MDTHEEKILVIRMNQKEAKLIHDDLSSFMKTHQGSEASLITEDLIDEIQNFLLGSR